jgi:uncharacterized Zn-binding protein involved in type VI secretion
MTRYYITVGDKTTAGGEVLDGSPTCTWHKKVLAISTSKIKCPACKTIGILQVNIPRRDTSPEGETFALNGDFCICKCNPPPTLLASQSINMYGGDVDAPTFGSTAVWSATDSFWTDAHDQHFQLHDENTGAPLSNRPFRIHCNGGTIDGVTDENGMTVKISANQIHEVKIEIFEIEHPSINPNWDE